MRCIEDLCPDYLENGCLSDCKSGSYCLAEEAVKELENNYEEAKRLFEFIKNNQKIRM